MTTYEALDEFTRGYIDAIFFTNSGDEQDELNNVAFVDFAPDALTAIVKDCEAFQVQHNALLSEAYDIPFYSLEQSGNDYWYTRNGHGVGFWDRGLGDIGDKLTTACEDQQVDAYVGDDGLIHLS